MVEKRVPSGKTGRDTLYSGNDNSGASGLPIAVWLQKGHIFAQSSDVSLGTFFVSCARGIVNALYSRTLAPFFGEDFMYTEFKEFYREFKPFFFGFVFIGLILAYGVFVYSVIEGWSLLESLYQVIITLSTVGFGEEHEMSRLGKIHTSILILLGVGGFAYLLGSFTEALIEGRIQMFWGRKKMERQIQSKQNHYIVCGFGRIGSVVVRELLQEGEDIVVIENYPDLVQSLE